MTHARTAAKDGFELFFSQFFFANTVVVRVKLFIIFIRGESRVFNDPRCPKDVDWTFFVTGYVIKKKKRLASPRKLISLLQSKI